MRISADFNEIYEHRYIWAALPSNNVVFEGGSVLSGPEIGDWVELFDYDGTSCLARVIGRGGQTIDCEVEWDSFQTVTTEVPGDLNRVYQSPPFTYRGETSSRLAN